MSRPSCTDERGQALTELVLAAAMLLPIFLLVYQFSRLVYARLELISLTRETALFLIHENRSDLPRGLVEDLAKKTRLDPDELSAKINGALMSGQVSSMPVLGTLGKMATGFLLGYTLEIKYHLKFGGVLGRALPDGIILTESAAFQSGCWKNLGLKDIAKMIFSLD